MKRNFEDKALRMAQLARQEMEWASQPQCLICRSWQRPCPACAARNGNGGRKRPLTPREIAQRVLDGRH
jgi:hypothetical protein